MKNDSYFMSERQKERTPNTVFFLFVCFAKPLTDSNRLLCFNSRFNEAVQLGETLRKQFSELFLVGAGHE